MKTTKSTITQLSYDIVGCAISVHKTLGAGLLESVYEECLAYELREKGFSVTQQHNAVVKYKKLEVNTTLNVDLLVNDLVVVELKTVDKLLPVHQSQLLTYMRILQKPQGLLINFFTDNITKSTIPLVNEYFRVLPD